MCRTWMKLVHELHQPPYFKYIGYKHLFKWIKFNYCTTFLLTFTRWKWFHIHPSPLMSKFFWPIIHEALNYRQTIFSSMTSNLLYIISRWISISSVLKERRFVDKLINKRKCIGKTTWFKGILGVIIYYSAVVIG